MTDTVECPYCEESFDMDNLDAESITTLTESRGECHGFPTYETITTGCTCPHCGSNISW